MEKIKIARVRFSDEKRLFGNPIIDAGLFGKSGYKSVINRISELNYSIITVPEYNEKVVKYANKKDIVVEDESEFLPLFFEKKFKDEFERLGPLNLGMIFLQDDARLAEKIAVKVARFCRFLTLPNYPRCRRVAEFVFYNNGLQINLENTLEKITKKCDIILDVENLELTSELNNQ